MGRVANPDGWAGPRQPQAGRTRARIVESTPKAYREETAAGEEAASKDHNLITTSLFSVPEDRAHCAPGLTSERLNDQNSTEIKKKVLDCPTAS